MSAADIAADLADEQAALDAVVATLDDQQWRRATPSPGWSVADQIGHLTYFDGTATLSITDADAFHASLTDLLATGDQNEGATLHRHLEPPLLLEAWRRNREALSIAAKSLADSDRLPWYGPPMSAKSFLTARLMECWAHGQDVLDAVGGCRPPTDRLRHIAQLGIITRGWTYANRGLATPVAPVRVELTSPSGATWPYGPDDADQVIRGPAEDFCLVVTQRRHVDKTALVIDGDAAREWLELAQAFAGPPTDGPAAGCI